MLLVRVFATGIKICKNRARLLSLESLIYSDSNNKVVGIPPHDSLILPLIL